MPTQMGEPLDWMAAASRSAKEPASWGVPELSILICAPPGHVFHTLPQFKLHAADLDLFAVSGAGAAQGVADSQPLQAFLQV